MRQRNLTFCLLAGLLVGFAPGNAMAQIVSIDIECPTEQASSTTLTVTLVYTNYSCSAVPIRTMSSIIANGDQTLGGIGVYGPTVIDDRMVPGASGGETSCGCLANQCDCSGISCTTDADCPYCSAYPPFVLNVERQAPPAIPESLDGTVAAYLFITETGAAGETDTEINECFVEVL